MTVCELTSHATERPWASRSGRVRWLRELALLAVLYAGYSAARLIGDADLNSALLHARDLLAIERLLHLDIEAPANAALAAWQPLAVLASYWYSLLHYVVTPAVLVWAYRRHHGDYRRVRDALVLASAMGLVGFTLLPMAPPRMLPGFVDTLASTSGAGWWGGDASAPRGLGALTNQLAAMPSLHVGWAVWVAWVVVTLSTRRLVRVLAVAYPVGTTLVVVATANHYLLDAVAGAAVVWVAIRLSRRLSPGSRQSTAHGSSEPGSGSVVVSSSSPSGSSRVTSAPLALGAPAPGSTSTTAPESGTASRTSARPGRR
jgi:hypothetical protein